jgi:hypothetical protein
MEFVSVAFKDHSRLFTFGRSRISFLKSLVWPCSVPFKQCINYRTNPLRLDNINHSLSPESLMNPFFPCRGWKSSERLHKNEELSHNIHAHLPRGGETKTFPLAIYLSAFVLWFLFVFALSLAMTARLCQCFKMKREFALLLGMRTFGKFIISGQRASLNGQLVVSFFL